MKKILLASAIAMAACGSVYAQDQGVYVGVKGGSFQVDIENASDPTGGGFLLGYNFGKGPAIEFERNSSGSISFSGGQNFYYGSAEIETTALYFAYRSEGTVFFKVRAGLLKEDVTVNSSYSGNDFGESDTGLSVGGGVGVNMGNIAQLEAEYTIIEQDVSLLSVGFNLRF